MRILYNKYLFNKLTIVLITSSGLLQHNISDTGGSPIPGPCGSIVVVKHVLSAITRKVVELTLLKKSLQLIGLFAEIQENILFINCKPTN